MNDKTQSGGDRNVVHRGYERQNTEWRSRNVVHREYERQNTEWRGSECRSSWV
ncbi:hypothetical protein [Metabacillus litoralis]|uniref:hypothetical protein n=1 Tax=Metabacillus litoralis TaxID=152268 RepID=UPI00203BA4C9|nr:hypothetical protein [Metabacillus litoralis]MCM3161027.1 hypothetical protein [Metabacillus litoralis]